MFIVTLCLFISAWLPFLSKIVVAVAMSKEGRYDNQYPREQQKRLTGFGARALAAHQNSFEALLIFAVATLTAMTVGNLGLLIQISAIVFIISRICYHITYLLDWPMLRSLIWFVGLVSSMLILFTSIPW